MYNTPHTFIIVPGFRYPQPELSATQTLCLTISHVNFG